MARRSRLYESKNPRGWYESRNPKSSFSGRQCDVTTKVDSEVADAYKLLEYYEDNGIVWWDSGSQEFVGLASDGEEVILGTTRERVVGYLVRKPSTDSW